MRKRLSLEHRDVENVKTLEDRPKDLEYVSSSQCVQVQRLRRMRHAVPGPDHGPEVLCEECGICAEVCPKNSIHFELPRFYGASEVHEAYCFKR